ncbi:putative ribonuclease H-like domain-containing protein [Tanacetum coccineum]
MQIQEGTKGKESYGDNGRRNATTNEPSSQALVTQDGLGGYDWESMIAKDKNGLGYGTQLDEMSNKSETDSEISMSIFEVRSSDEEITPANDRFSKADGYHVVPPPITGNFLTPRADISFAGLDEYAIRKKIIESKANTVLKTDTSKSKTSETVGNTNEVNVEKPKSVNKSVVSTPNINKDKVIIEDWNSDDEDDVIEVRVLTRTGLVNPVRPNEKRAVQTINTARPVSTARSVSTAWPISTARPFAPKTAQTSSVVRPIYPRMDNVRPRASSSQIKRSYYTKPAFRPKNLKQDVKTSGVKNMTTAGTRAVVNTGKGKMDNDLKKSRWVWRPKGNYMDHESKEKGSFILKKFEYGNPEIFLQDHAVVDSGCSSHMTGNKAYLSDYEDYNGGFVAFGSDPKGGKITGKGKIKTANLDFDNVYFVDELKFNLFSVSQMCDKKNSVLFTDTECLILSPSFKLLDESQVVLRAPRKDDVYSLDLKNIVPSGGITCLYANATSDESKLWHRRLGHVNFKNINKLVKGHLVRGLPSKVFVNDYTCVACKKGKQHKASCKAKLERTIRKPLELLHMDLFGPVSVESINKKKYCLVVTDDFSRFSWVFFLATKDETAEILCKFIIGLENQLNHKVKIIRCDHGTEFKNHAMNEFCAKKGIKREFSVAKTPQQNGVAERNILLLRHLSEVNFNWQMQQVRILHCLSPKSGGWDQFGSPIATALIWDYVPLLPVMLAGAAEDQGEGSAIPAEPQHTPTDPGPTFTHVADEATTTGVRVGTEGATTTTSGLDAGLDSGNIHESPLRSHEAPLHEGHTSGSAEDNLQLKELMVLVPKLVTRIANLEKELHQTKTTYGKAVLTLVERVKSLEVALKRKTKKVVVSDSEDEETENQGRKIQDIDDDPLVSWVRESMKEKDTDFVTPTKISASGEVQEQDIGPTILEAAKTLSHVISQKAKSTDKVIRYKRKTRSKSIEKDISTDLDDDIEVNPGSEDFNTGNEDFNTDSLGVSTGSGPVSTPSVVQTINVTIPSPIKKAMRLQALQEEEAARQVHLDALLAKRISEEEELSEQQKKRKAEVQEAAQYYTEEDWDTIRAKLEANAELTKSLQEESMTSEDFAKRMVEMINQKRSSMLNKRLRQEGASQ